MSDKRLHVVWIGLPQGATLPWALPASSPWGPFTAESIDTLDVLSAGESQPAAALLLYLPSGAQAQPIAWPALSAACADAAVLVVTAEVDITTQQRLLTTGVQDVVLESNSTSLAQRVRLAVERRAVENEAVKAYATDLGTGLPNRQQLIEHMSQILALREREPKPVSVLVFRIDGLQGLEAARGQESANVVRRKVAVRLRAGVRASDVVASLGVDAFAVLLSSTESPADATHVVDKLQRWLREPVTVTGASVALSTFVGVAQFPKDGRQPDELLRHASAAALLGAYGMQPGAANDPAT